MNTENKPVPCFMCESLPIHTDSEVTHTLACPECVEEDEAYPEYPRTAHGGTLERAIDNWNREQAANHRRADEHNAAFWAEQAGPPCRCDDLCRC